MKINKRSLSTVVASLLMVLLVVVAVGIVSQIIIPMVREDLSSAGSCLDAMGNVEINKEYTCFDLSASDIKISIETKKIKVDGFVISYYMEGNSKSTTIDAENYELPGENEARLYPLIMPLGFIPEIVKVAPIVNGEICNEMDQLILSPCPTI